MRAPYLAMAFLFPVVAWAVGPDWEEPTQTRTTSECEDGQVWDEDAQACVNPVESSLDDDALYQAAREFAFAGQYANAQAALAAMSDPREDRVLTYLGFTARKSGNTAQGMAYYREALAQNPDNLLARSYMGQGLVKLGDIDGAKLQLAEIRSRGGAGSWPAIALSQAIATGFSNNY